MDSHAALPQRILMGIYYYYSIASGMTSYRYDFRATKHHQTPLARYSAVFLNSLTLLMLPWYIWECFNFPVDHTINALMKHSNDIAVIVRVLTITYTVTYSFKRERSMNTISSTMLSIKTDFFEQQLRDDHIESNFNLLMYAKFSFVAYNVASSVFHSFCGPHMNQAWWYACATAFMTFQLYSVIEVTIVSYFLTLWYICRIYSYANKRLETLRVQLSALAELRGGILSRHTELLCSDLQQVLHVHWQLGGVVRRLNTVYRFQMLAVRFNCFVSTVLMGYFGCIFTVDNLTALGMLAYGLFTYIIIVLDLYFVDFLAHMTVSKYNGTIYILKRFNGFTLWHNRLRNTCEEFALLLCSCKLRLDSCGLFVVNKNLWFRMFATVITYTIYLYQFHKVLINQQRN